jgi:hypothetical protein
MVTASEAREPDAYRDCSNRLLERVTTQGGPDSSRLTERCVEVASLAQLSLVQTYAHDHLGEEEAKLLLQGDSCAEFPECGPDAQGVLSNPVTWSGEVGDNGLLRTPCRSASDRVRQGTQRERPSGIVLPTRAEPARRTGHSACRNVDQFDCV